MEDLNTSDLIAIAEARGEVRGLPPNTTLEDQLRTAMRSVRNNWLIGGDHGDQGRQMRVACAAVCLEVGLDSPEGQRVAKEHKSLSIIGRVLEMSQMGIAADLGDMVTELPKEPIGLLKLWREVTTR